MLYFLKDIEVSKCNECGFFGIFWTCKEASFLPHCQLLKTRLYGFVFSLPDSNFSYQNFKNFIYRLQNFHDVNWKILREIMNFIQIVKKHRFKEMEEIISTTTVTTKTTTSATTKATTSTTMSVSVSL